MQIALCASDFRDIGNRDIGVAVDVRGRLGGDSKSLESMLDGSMDVDAGDIEFRLPCRANRHTIDERLNVME